MALEKSGLHERADEYLSSGGTFVQCHAIRGDILDLRGDWQGAEGEYRSAIALAPDLSGGYYHWGVALARHGDLREAELKLKEANKRSPHWADPLKAWGDVLEKEGRVREALAKYNAALRYAPNWAALRDSREILAHR